MKYKNKVLLILIFMTIILILIFLLNKDNILTSLVSYSKLNNESLKDNFKMAVFAVCEEKENYILCEDKIFVSCNKKIIKVEKDYVECDERIYEIPKMNLEKRKYEKNWTDIRQENFLEEWANE